MINGRWDSMKLNLVLPRHITDRIEAIFLDGEIRRDDDVYWKFSSNGTFSSKSAYWLVSERGNGSWSWNFIWKMSVSPKIKTFL